MAAAKGRRRPNPKIKKNKKKIMGIKRQRRVRHFFLSPSSEPRHTSSKIFVTTMTTMTTIFDTTITTKPAALPQHLVYFVIDTSQSMVFEASLLLPCVRRFEQELCDGERTRVRYVLAHHDGAVLIRDGKEARQPRVRGHTSFRTSKASIATSSQGRSRSRTRTVAPESRRSPET